MRSVPRVQILSPRPFSRRHRSLRRLLDPCHPRARDRSPRCRRDSYRSLAVRGAPREDPPARDPVVRGRPRPREWITGEAVDEGSRRRSGGGAHRRSRAHRRGRAADRVARRGPRRRDLLRGPQPAGGAADRAGDLARTRGGSAQQASPARARAPAPGWPCLSPKSGIAAGPSRSMRTAPGDACRQSSGAVGFQGPSMTVASLSPGQRGIEMQRNSSGSTPVQRYWNAVPTGMSMETPALQNGRLFTCAVSSPDLPLARENVPELAHRGVDGRPIHLTWRDGGVDHVAGLAFHQVPDLCPGRGAGIGGGGERAGLHGEPPCASKHYPDTDASDSRCSPLHSPIRRRILNRMVQYVSGRLDASFAALSDATRRGVLEQLGRADASITDLAQTFHMTLTGMRKHVGVLEQAELVTTEKVGRVRTCRLGPRRLEAGDGMDRAVPPALGLTLRRVGQGRRGIETEGEGRWTQRERVSSPP